MQAYEFYAVPENGVITIPEQYRDKIKTGVKVILLEEESLEFNKEEANERSKSDLLLPPILDTSGWKIREQL